MSTLPDSSDFSSLGGSLNNYTTPLDSSTDLDAAADNAVRLNVAQMTRTALRAWVTFQGSATSPVISSYDGVWGSSVSYAPSGTLVSTGQYRITWPSSVVDDLGVTRYLNLRAGWCNVATSGSKAEGSAQAYVESPNTVLVTCFSASLCNNLANRNVQLFVI